MSDDSAIQFTPDPPQQPGSGMRINPNLVEAKVVRIDSLTVDPANVRLHSERNLATIKGSLAKFGQQRSILVNGNVVVAGNGTLTAAMALGATEIAVTQFDGDSAAAAVAYGIADNRTGELATWDFLALKDQLAGLKDDNFDLIALGWDKDELHNLMISEFVPPEKEPLPEPGDRGGQPIRLTPMQRELFDQCAVQLRTEEADSTMSDGDVLEAVCRYWLSVHVQ